RQGAVPTVGLDRSWSPSGPRNPGNDHHPMEATALGFVLETLHEGDGVVAYVLHRNSLRPFAAGQAVGHQDSHRMVTQVAIPDPAHEDPHWLSSCGRLFVQPA